MARKGTKNEKRERGGGGGGKTTRRPKRRGSVKRAIDKATKRRQEETLALLTEPAHVIRKRQQKEAREAAEARREAAIEDKTISLYEDFKLGLAAPGIVLRIGNERKYVHHAKADDYSREVYRYFRAKAEKYLRGKWF